MTVGSIGCLLWVATTAPLLGAFMTGILGARLSERWNAFFALAATGASFLFGSIAFGALIALEPDARLVISPLYVWIVSGDFTVSVGLALDQLSGVWLMVVTGVGFVIHIYAVGYMSGEAGFARFFSYMNLFVFAMMILILADNYALMFIGWEGVGLCSYLLIGYYHEKKSAADAGKKAFIMNRIGDLAFLIAMVWIFSISGALEYRSVFASVASLDAYQSASFFGLKTIDLIALLIFAGAVGKSAQIPLYTWLPDAMEGPTPVSALIHAATMVTAGIYIVARSAAIFDLSPLAMTLVAIIGLISALLAATMGMWNYDIKRVLAYSTVSQLGYMFMALGLGAYTAAVFHVVTHAFFKACLFLGAGSVIHGMDGEQDIRRMGALKEKMPMTHLTFLISTLAISGIPPLAGFFSKDEILLSAFFGHAQGRLIYWAIATFASMITAFYMFRLYYLTFAGSSRADSRELFEKVHESPRVMTWPLVVLAFGALSAGALGIPLKADWHALRSFLDPIFRNGAQGAHHISVGSEIALMAVSVALALVGIFIARHFYLRDLSAARALALKGGLVNFWYWLIRNKYFIDEIYTALIVAPIVWLWRNLFHRLIDVIIIDGIVNGVGAFFFGAADSARPMQSGRARGYATIITLGALALAVLSILTL